MADWRRHLHAHPETGFEEHRTAAFVAGILREAGLEVATGIGGTGVVGTLRRGGGNRAIGLRADMDALLIEEQGEHPHRSTVPGRMHACGHDGHTAALLGAACALAEAPDFDGTVHFIFQPAEEHGRGMRAMLDDGLLRRFPIDEAYGLHNMPGLPIGHFATAAGPIMAAEDNFVITVTGRGGHAARPQVCIDPILAASAIVLALQQIVSRRLDPVDRAVVSVTEFLTDGTRNVIPTTARLLGDCRSFRPEVSAAIEAAMGTIATATAAAHGATATLAYSREFIPTINAAEPTAAALRAAGQVMRAADASAPPMMGSEDFAQLLAEVPGNFAFVGNGIDCAGLHNPAYDFDDRALPGMRDYYLALVRDRLPKDGA
jgi:hippurate hydrolase